MKLTPLEVKQKQFPVRLRGIDKSEVGEFLHLVAEEMEELARENNELKMRQSLLDAAIEEHRAREVALKETLVTAQKMAEEVKRMAEREAQVLLSNAELEGERVIEGALKRRESLLNDVYDLKRQKVQFETSLRHTIELHLKLLDALRDYDAERAVSPGVEDVSFLAHQTPSPKESRQNDLPDCPPPDAFALAANDPLPDAP